MRIIIRRIGPGLDNKIQSFTVESDEIVLAQNIIRNFVKRGKRQSVSIKQKMMPVKSSRLSSMTGSGLRFSR